MPPNARDQMMLDELAMLRRDMRLIKYRQGRLEHVVNRYDHRIGASLSKQHQRVLIQRQAKVRAELELLAVELADTRLTYRNKCTDAKLRGLITDNDIIRWLGEDYAQA